MTPARPLRVVEVADGVPGAVCGRLLAGLGHDVALVTTAGSAAFAVQPPRDHEGEGLAHAALHAGKRLGDLGELAGADVAIIEVGQAERERLDLEPGQLAARHPGLVVVSITGFAPGDGPDWLPADSLLAEAHGGLATMIGEAERRPLALGGEQVAHCAGVVGFLGASVSLRRRDAGGGGDVVDVAMADVAAYMDWKSDVSFSMTGQAPRRSGAHQDDWRLVRARDRWVGFIFQPRHWPSVVELVGADELRDPRLQDQATRLAAAQDWWPAVERWAARHDAEWIYARAQALGLPFGWATQPSDLLASAQLRDRGFVPEAPATAASVVGSPVLCPELPWDSGTRAPSAAAPVLPPEPERPVAALDGVVVLDFGTITAGAATTRLLADYGATVLKVEWPGRPDTFRSWKVASSPDGEPAPTSPFFASNNVGKLGVAINLKTPEGRALVRGLARRSHLVVENYRVGVTARLGIDAESLRQVNPELLYLSLSSQGQHGPEAGNSSYGSTLDLLSGLAAVTGYEPDRPLWSSADVNYPDQLVSLFGAAFLAYAIQQRTPGAHLDVSQREVVSWTLAAELADRAVNGRDAEPTGNRRPGRTPHDTYPCAEPDTWIALSCESDEQRHALAGCLEADELTGRDADWWAAEADRVDGLIAEWARTRTRASAVAALHAAGVPAVAVRDARDRREDAGLLERQVSVSDDGVPVKGLPLRFRDYAVAPSLAAPALGEHTRAVLESICGLTDDELDGLEERGIIFCGRSAQPLASNGA